MKLINNIVNKLGWDKIVHFLVAYIMVTIFYIFSSSINWTALGLVVTCFLSIIKEYGLDTDTGADFEDLKYSFIGAFIGFSTVLIAIIFI